MTIEPLSAPYIHPECRDDRCRMMTVKGGCECAIIGEKMDLAGRVIDAAQRFNISGRDDHRNEFEDLLGQWGAALGKEPA